MLPCSEAIVQDKTKKTCSLERFLYAPALVSLVLPATPCNAQQKSCIRITALRTVAGSIAHSHPAPFDLHLFRVDPAVPSGLLPESVREVDGTASTADLAVAVQGLVDDRPVVAGVYVLARDGQPGLAVLV